MQPFLEGFADELVKLSATDRSKGDLDLKRAYREARKDTGAYRHRPKHPKRESSESYLLSMALGALAAPAALVGGRKILRPLAKRFTPKYKVPHTTVPEMGGSMMRGALAGAIIKMMRDRFSTVGDRKDVR